MKPAKASPDGEAAAARARSLVLQSMLLAAGLAGLKAAAGLAAHSLALLASALDSAMDLLSSGVNYVTLVFSQHPPDEEHPYGHGKLEAVAGAAQGALIAAGGLALLTESIRRVVSNEPVEAGWFSLSVMVLSMMLSAVHGRRLSRAAVESASPILRAEGLHFSMDVLANFGVLFALGVIRLGAGPAWDVLISIIVAGYVVWEAVRLLSSAGHQLIDRRLSDEMQAQIEGLIREHHPSIVGFHDFRTRSAGNRIFIDFHVEISGVEKFSEAHEITESLIDKIKGKIPNADVTVHSDPAGAR